MTHPTLPTHFQFSQGSLQAYVDCPKLFQLRYIERVSWPAPESEPSLDTENYIKLGASFHKLVQQYFLGVNPERLRAIAMRDPLLHQWWDNFLYHKPNSDGYAHHSEIKLSTPQDQFRLVAKFDMVFIKNTPLFTNENVIGNLSTESSELNGDLIIYDWKTSRKLPERRFQASRLQTRVYPYVLVKAGTNFLANKAIEPDQIKMVYWFSNHPTKPLQFNYSQDSYEKDGTFLSALINEIKTIATDEARKTQNQKRCRYCGYRSLCNRGVIAGPYLGSEEEDHIQHENLDLDIDFDFDQISEIEF